MVLQKRLDYGFNGYQVPHIPRATRSARKRRILTSKADDNQMCPFDLLATVAGKLLLDNNNNNNVKDSIKKEDQKIVLNKSSDQPVSAITCFTSCKLECENNNNNNNNNKTEMCGSDHTVKLPSCGSSSVNKEDVKLGTRDDDENSVCTQINKDTYKHQRSFKDYPFKKRKLYYDQALNVIEPTIERTNLQSKDSHVKFKIKSFRVPEFFIEIPETATIASLKRSVMKAVTSILGGNGVHVGVLLQGKKIKDDNKTLLQTGISRDNNQETLGFILEPISSPTICSEATPLKQYSVGPTPMSIISNVVDSDHDSAPSPPDEHEHEQNIVDSRALVTLPNLPSMGITMRKPKKSTESAQRRIRRPFSVSEVEALVQAVEKLGTGRWRDVKIRAFDTAKHRTYVDLKDKWKTLVHTARISPQQRRGEPVPQELLDRVLMAHAYWSQHQAKQQLKHHSEACFLL